MRVFNKKYWPHQLHIAPDISIRELERYCYDNFKTSDWRNKEHYFVFKSSQDFTLFALRWS